MEAEIQSKFKDNSINGSDVSLHISLNEKIGHRRMKMKNWLTPYSKQKIFLFNFVILKNGNFFPKFGKIS